MKLPRYNKASTQDYTLALTILNTQNIEYYTSILQSAYGGRGDRADPSTWPEVEGPLTVGGVYGRIL